MSLPLIANYHTHTFRCGHASQAPEREYVEKAIADGIKILGFSDHTPYPGTANFPGRPGIRMDLSELDGYCETVLALRDEYRDEIEIHLGEKVEDLGRFAGKDVIVATGAVPRKLNLPGFDKTVEACEYLRGKEVGDDVAVIGGGLTGCEIAYELALQGKKVSIIEMKNDLIAQTGVCLANSSYLREWFALHEVPVYLNTTVTRIEDGKVVCSRGGKEIEVPCGSVISSAGYIPAPLTKEGGKVRLVGDCKTVGNLRTVIWQAYEAAMKV